MDLRYGGNTKVLHLSYVGALLIGGIFCSRGQIAALALVESGVMNAFTPGATWPNSLGRFALTFPGLACAPLLLNEIIDRKRFEALRCSQTGRTSARPTVADDARAIIESSSAAILTIAHDGNIETANEAACRLLLGAPGAMSNRNIREFVPILADLLTRRAEAFFVRSMIEGRGRRSNGDMFLAHMWLSTYSTPIGPKLSVVLADVSEQICDREAAGLRQLAINSQIIASAVSNEVATLAAVGRHLHETIGCSSSIAREDFTNLGRVIEEMCNLGWSRTPARLDQSFNDVDLNALFSEVEIIARREYDDCGVEFPWELAQSLPRVRARRSGLLQVSLSLIQNSCVAARETRNGCVTIAAYALGDSVTITIAGNGPELAYPEVSFQPFQTNAECLGLGLYVLRATIRMYGGELSYAKRSAESGFQIELPTACAEVSAIG